jgi:O-methyltransferase involved in polyketide biosynthesis
LSDSGRISPTAHYTGYVWARNGLSHPELETLEGRILFESLRLPMAVNGALGGGTLESYLLARHKAIDARLERAIEGGRVKQVIEVACGFSPRGLRFTDRYGDRMTYVEADLPGMARRKRAALDRIGSLSEFHRVEEVDALKDGGPGSLAEIASTLDPARGLAIITEGLLGYLERSLVDGIWGRFAATVAGFRQGVYISDIHMGELQNVQVRAFRVLLSAFVRGRVYLHFGNEEEILDALHRAGFTSAEVRRASEVSGEDSDRGSRLAHIIEASTAQEPRMRGSDDRDDPV